MTAIQKDRQTERWINRKIDRNIDSRRTDSWLDGLVKKSKNSSTPSKKKRNLDNIPQSICPNIF